MYNEILLPQQAKMKEDVVPPNDVIKNVAKLDAMISLEVDAGFDSWKAAVDARNRSLDGAIVASRLFKLRKIRLLSQNINIKKKRRFGMLSIESIRCKNLSLKS